MYDINAHINSEIEFISDKSQNYIQSIQTREEQIEFYKHQLTTIDRQGRSTVTPSVGIDDIKYSQRIMNQKGVFVYHANNLPFDQVIYTISNKSAYQYRRIFKISNVLKSKILNLLDTNYSINKTLIYPDEENSEIIEEAVKMTKLKFGMTT